MTTLEYRKHQYASTYADIIQNLTADNIADYFLDIINILCIPYDMRCRRSSDYIDHAQLENENMPMTKYRNYHIDCIKINKGWLYGFNLNRMHIDTSKSLILYDIMKLLCTTPASHLHLHWYDPNYTTLTLNVNLLPSAILHYNNNTPRTFVDHITCVFVFNTKLIAPRINIIKDALHKVYDRRAIAPTSTAIATAIATAHIKLETTDATLAPLAEAKIVA